MKYSVQYGHDNKRWFDYGAQLPELFDAYPEAQATVDMLTAPTGPGGMSLAVYARVIKVPVIDLRSGLWGWEIPHACANANPGDLMLFRAKWQVKLAEICLRHLGIQNVRLEVVDG